MLIPSRHEMARRPLVWLLALLALVATAFVARISAQDSGAKDRIYVITHVDTPFAKQTVLRWICCNNT